MKNNRKRLYLWVAIVAILAVAVLAVSFVVINRNSDNNQTEYECDYIDYDNLTAFEQECQAMTHGQRLYLKHQLEEAINRVEMELQADTLNPEECHEVVVGQTQIKKKLEILNRYL